MAIAFDRILQLATYIAVESWKIRHRGSTTRATCQIWWPTITKFLYWEHSSSILSRYSIYTWPTFLLFTVRHNNWIGWASKCLYGTVFVVGLLGNTLVIYVVLRYTKMQTVTNLYILNLAVADECFLIGIPFIMTTMGLGYWPFGNVMCKVKWSATIKTDRINYSNCPSSLWNRFTWRPRQLTSSPALCF